MASVSVERLDHLGVVASVIKDWVVYLSPADKYPRLTRRLSKGQKVLYERALVASQRPSEPW
jgi:hypothetical protein